MQTSINYQTNIQDVKRKAKILKSKASRKAHRTQAGKDKAQ